MDKYETRKKQLRYQYITRRMSAIALLLSAISLVITICSMGTTSKASSLEPVPRKYETPTIEPTPTAEPQFESLGTYTTTAYCACKKCCGKSDGITASGTKAKAGRTIAADTKVLPFGTRVYINGNEYIVEDRGGAIKGKKIDIFFDSHSEALKYGKKKVEVFVKKY